VKTGRLPSSEYGIDDIYKDKNGTNNQATDATCGNDCLAKSTVDCATKWTEVEEACSKGGSAPRRFCVGNGAYSGTEEMEGEKGTDDGGSKGIDGLDVAHKSNAEGSNVKVDNSERDASRSKILSAWVTLNSPDETCAKK